MQARPTKMLSVVLIAICLHTLSCTRARDVSVSETMARGNRIVASLERYKTDHTRYPMALRDMIPRYLSSIDPPLIGEKKWTYTLADRGEAFTLAARGENDSDMSC